MKTFHFTTDDAGILSLLELKRPLVLSVNPFVENVEGIYIHGKVNAENKEKAKDILFSTVIEDFDYEATLMRDE